MRNLSSTLIAAQQSASRVPHMKVELSNRVYGAIRLSWERLYTGLEPENRHALAVSGNGALVRARISPPADGRKLYRQTVTDPGPGSNFGTWIYTNQYDCLAIAAAALGNLVSLFWINTNREMRRTVSTDYGNSWGSPELINYSPTTVIGGMAAAYKPNGDLALFFTDQSTLYVQEYHGGTWQARAAWDKITGDLSGAAVVYDQDWDLMVTGTRVSGEPQLWSLVYGDGGVIPAGDWSDLTMMAAAAAGGQYEFNSPFLDKADVFRCYYIEKFNGNQSYSRLFGSHLVPGTAYKDGLWREAEPYNILTEGGAAPGHSPGMGQGWLATASGVWQADLGLQTVDISGDVCSLKLDIKERRGRSLIELRNDDRRYSLLTPPLQSGCLIEVSPGYVSTAGNETSSGQSFILESVAYHETSGRNRLVLEAYDGWRRLQEWRARDQFRWNKDTAEKSVKEILAFILARAGLRLEVKSESEFISTFYPDFIIHPGNSGDLIVDRLLSLTSDLLFIEGGAAYLVNPLTTDISCYAYGTVHGVIEDNQNWRMPEANWIRVEGVEPVSQQPILADYFDWEDIAGSGDRDLLIQDTNLNSTEQLEERGQAYLRKMEIKAISDELTVAVNCGQQLYDVVDITVGEGIERTRRVTGAILVYDPFQGKYEQKLRLGGV